MKQSPLEQKVSELAEPVLKDMGFDLVLVEFSGGALQILAENPETGNLNLEECTKISRALSPVLEVEDPIDGAYRLEISSPGVDRPLVRPEDFTRFNGYEVKIELDMPLEGQKRFRGFIRDQKDGIVSLETDQGMKELPVADVQKAKLVMNDSLIHTGQKKKVLN